jgi:3-oxoacyl-[acyl-carrier protein] reductase
MDFGIKGKCAIISGGSKGVGRAISLELAAEGVRVAIAARGRAALDETVAAIRAKGGEAIGIVADMVVKEQVDAAVAEATSSFGAPDIAISNVDAPDARSGAGYRCGLEDAADEDFTAAFDSMLMSIVHLTRAVIPGMKAKQWGRLLNIGSRAAKQPHAPPSQMILSNFARPGVMGLMKTLSYEYGIYNITANIIATGPFDTERTKEYFESRGVTIAEQEAAMRKMGMGVCRLGKPEELAALAAFLCSERASFISGETITITGGMHTGLF